MVNAIKNQTLKHKVQEILLSKGFIKDEIQVGDSALEVLGTLLNQHLESMIFKSADYLIDFNSKNSIRIKRLTGRILEKALFGMPTREVPANWTSQHEKCHKVGTSQNDPPFGLAQTAKVKDFIGIDI